MSDGNVKTVYMMGIGGIAMGTLATMLKEKGYFVVGSDVNLYPPMSDHLESLHIPLFKGYNVENLSKYPPDLVIIGNVIRRENAEAQQVLNQGIPYLSMPEAISRFFLCKHQSIVVAGTHGKSTTSSLLSWILTYAGLDPSTFVGAFLKNCERSYRIGNGRYMVLEGDEYDTAFFDKGSKFLHYRPHIGIITRIAKTGIFFKKYNEETLNKAIDEFEKMKFLKKDCFKQAQKFNEKKFMKQLLTILNSSSINHI